MWMPSYKLIATLIIKFYAKVVYNFAVKLDVDATYNVDDAIIMYDDAIYNIADGIIL